MYAYYWLVHKRLPTIADFTGAQIPQLRLFLAHRVFLAAKESLSTALNAYTPRLRGDLADLPASHRAIYLPMPSILNEPAIPAALPEPAHRTRNLAQRKGPVRPRAAGPTVASNLASRPVQPSQWLAQSAAFPSGKHPLAVVCVIQS